MNPVSRENRLGEEKMPEIAPQKMATTPTKQGGGGHLFMRDLTPLLQANGMYAQYQEYVRGYMQWRQGQAAGARGEIGGPRKSLTDELDDEQRSSEERRPTGAVEKKGKKTISLLMPGCSKWGDKAKLIQNYFRKLHKVEIEILDAADAQCQLAGAPADGGENVVIALEKENLVSVVEALRREGNQSVVPDARASTGGKRGGRVQALVLASEPQLYFEMDDKAEVDWRQFADAADPVHGALRFTEIPTCNLQTCTEAELTEWVRQQEKDRKGPDDAGSSREASTEAGSTEGGSSTDGSEDGHNSDSDEVANSSPRRAADEDHVDAMPTTDAAADCSHAKRSENLLILKPADEAASVGQAVLPASAEDPASMEKIFGYWQDKSEMGYIAQPFFATHKILTIDFLAIDGELKGHSMFFVDGPIKNEHWKSGLYQQVPENAPPRILRQFEKIKALTERLCKERRLNGIFEIEFLYTGREDVDGFSSENEQDADSLTLSTDGKEDTTPPYQEAGVKSSSDSPSSSAGDGMRSEDGAQSPGGGAGHLYFLELNLLPGLYGVDKNGLMPVLERVVVPYLQYFGVEIQQRTQFEFAPQGQFYPPSQKSFQYYVDTYEQKDGVGKENEEAAAAGA